METGCGVQGKAGCDVEEVNTISLVRSVLTKFVAAICPLFIVSATAQITRAPLVIKDPNDFHRYALYCPKPEYPINLRDRRIGGSGNFLLHLRPDGTVQSVATLKSIGHVELDEVTKSAFIKWRFRPGPAEVTEPITFKVPRGTASWPFAR